MGRRERRERTRASKSTQSGRACALLYGQNGWKRGQTCGQLRRSTIRPPFANEDFRKCGLENSPSNAQSSKFKVQTRFAEKWCGKTLVRTKIQPNRSENFATNDEDSLQGPLWQKTPA